MGARKIKRITNEMLEQAHEYMRMWIEPDSWSDLAVMLDHMGDTIQAADYLVGAGAISSESIRLYGASDRKETALESELVIEELARRFRSGSEKARKRHVRNTFKDVFIASCNDCNCVSFLADGNEKLYPEVKTECWECKSTNIETRRGIR